MSLSDSTPDYVLDAKEAADKYRDETSDRWYAKQDAKPLNVTPLRPAWLDAVVQLGRADFCPECGLYIPVCDLNNGKHLRECADCKLVVEERADG